MLVVSGLLPERLEGTLRLKCRVAKVVQSVHFGLLGTPMRYVSASEAKQRLAALLDAAQREPVMIRRQNRDVAVVISPADYRRLTSTNVEAFQRFCDRVSAAAKARGMTGEKLDEMLND